MLVFFSLWIAFEEGVQCNMLVCPKPVWVVKGMRGFVFGGIFSESARIIPTTIDPPWQLG